MKLTIENYFSKEADMKYLSVSQYKSFCGCAGIRPCEAMALAKLRGEWTEEPSQAMLIGSYVDAHFCGTLDLFRAQHPEIFKKSGELLAAFEGANEVIARIERDPYFMRHMSGDKQRIFTGTLFGAEWKCMVDVIDPKVHITDLKVMKSLSELFWVRDLGHVSFPQYWGYIEQGAVYQEIVFQNIKKRLPFFIAAASKEQYPDIRVIGFTQKDLSDALSLIEPNIARILKLKSGNADAVRCERCDYCRSTRVLTGPIHFSELT